MWHACNHVHLCTHTHTHTHTVFVRWLIVSKLNFSWPGFGCVFFQCEVEGCGQTFRKRHQLRAHNFSHTNVDPYKCSHPGCLRTFETSDRLRRHLKAHQGELRNDWNGAEEVTLCILVCFLASFFCVQGTHMHACTLIHSQSRKPIKIEKWVPSQLGHVLQLIYSYLGASLNTYY